MKMLRSTASYLAIIVNQTKTEEASTVFVTMFVHIPLNYIEPLPLHATWLITNKNNAALTPAC